MKKILLAATSILALAAAACTSPEITLVHTDFDPYTQHRWTSIQGPIDMAGGMRQTLMCPADLYGRMDGKCYDTSAPGTLQGFMAGGFGGLMEGAGLATGLGLLKPATTMVNNAANSTGASVSPGAATSNAVAKGGRGGVGGTGGNATATGGTGIGGAGGAGGTGVGPGGVVSGGTVSASAVSSPTVSSTSRASSRAASNPTISNANTNTVSPSITNTNTPSVTSNATGGTLNSVINNNCVNPTQCVGYGYHSIPIQ
jgi:hypothetical protein